MLYFREIANHRRDHTVDGLFELAVVDMDFEPNVQGLNAGVMLQAVLSELVALGCAQSGEPRDFIHHHKIEHSSVILSRSSL